MSRERRRRPTISRARPWDLMPLEEYLRYLIGINTFSGPRESPRQIQDHCIRLIQEHAAEMAEEEP